MDPIGAAPRVDLSAIVHPKALEHAPRLVEVVERDAALQDAQVRDAHARLGAPGSTPRDAWRELGRTASIGASFDESGFGISDEGRALLRRNAHVIGIDLGTSVALPEAPFDQHLWNVVGVGGSDRLQLARRLPDGTLERQTRRWPELVAANPALAESHLIAPAGPKAMPSVLRELTPPEGTPQPLVDAWDAARSAARPADRIYQQVSTVSLGPDAPPLVLGQGSWSELARDLKLSRLRPIPVAPSDGWNAASLVEAAGPRPDRFAFAAEADQLLGKQLLVGTDALPPGHRITADAAELERISAWYDELGLRTWRGRLDQLVLTTGLADSIANASAHGNADYSLVNFGLRDKTVRDEMLNLVPGPGRDAMRDGDDALRRNWKAVLTHEVGHVAVQQVWGVDVGVEAALAKEAGDVQRYAAVAEHGIANEAFSDLFAAARTQQRDIGARDLGRLRNGIGDLDQLRATIAKLGLDHTGHTGTQLITKPMLELQRRHGWDAVAEVTASATNRIGAMLARGDIDAVDVTTASRVLRDSAAMRFGAEDDVVRAMTTAWAKLRVII